MKKNKLPLIFLLVTLGLSLCGAALRVYQLKSCMSENGLIREGNPILYIMLGFALLSVVLLGFLASRLNSVTGTERCLSAPAGYLLADLVGADIIFYGALMRLMDGGSVPVFVAGMVAALCLAAAALLYVKRSKHVFWLLIVPALFFGGLLILDFKRWSTDPLVIDFCFRQLALVCGMLAVLHVAGFPLRVGRKRLTVFWCAGAVLFSMMVVPDFFLNQAISLGELLIPVGLAVWCAGHALRLLRNEVQSELPQEAALSSEDAPLDEELAKAAPVEAPKPNPSRGRFEQP